MRAHIIPRAFYDLPPADADATKILGLSKESRPKITRTGVYDENILCAECDGQLGKLDQHAAEHLLQKGPTRALELAGEPMGRFYDQADPKKMRAFAASVIWRASISTQEFFSRVRLGPYEVVMRQALRSERDYGGVEAVIAEFEKLEGGMLNPHSTRFEGVRFWLVYTSRFIFYVKVDQQAIPTFLEPFALRHGRNVCSIVRSWQTSKELNALREVVLANPNAFRTKA